MSNNTVTLVGRLTNDPNKTMSQSGMSIAKFGIAQNRGEGDARRAEYYDITAFRGLADNVFSSLRKGDQVVVSGRLEFSRWADSTTGEIRQKVGVIANSVGADLTWATANITKIAAPNSADEGRATAVEVIESDDEESF